ncbi:MAG: DNA-binding protein [Lutibacter sp.]|uniref:DNA-binding protein n=1 Tax=Lutibacter sp. TaxID=1925666 RepID=UPI00185583BF|nr:DNA-binding protein [Lutibacter sp.]MBT8316073.1 DNA-binding protein [Lutibacter sp.]NNJ56932.1 DNA-binding protein [Lutibacter sp.]
MDLKVGDKVDLLVVRNTGIGFTVLVNEEFEGLLYKNELYQKIEEGQKLVGYLKKIREDEKLDVSLQPVGFKNVIVKNEIAILKALKKEGGFIGLHDKSSPDDIKYQLGMSKKAFKNAVGGLFRQKLITISEEGISLIYVE